jgi:four helix bundle protein
MATIRQFEDIDAWKKARELTQEIYRVTSGGKFGRDFGLRDQIRRASVSIMSNIAEGFERNGNKELTQFLALAQGSCGEVRSQLYIAHDQDYLSRDEFATLVKKAKDVSCIISGFIAYLRKTQYVGRKFITVVAP